MAITAPAEGAVLATDEISSVHYPRTKVGFGDDGSYTDVSESAPLPVEVVSGGGGDASAALQTAGNNLLTALVGATDGLEAAIAALTTALGSPLQAGGNVAVTGSALPTGAATSAKQDTGIAALGTIGTRAYGTALSRVAVINTSAQSAAITATEVLVHASTRCFIATGTNPTATTNDIPLEAGEKFHLRITSGQRIGVIRDTADGFLNVVPVA